MHVLWGLLVSLRPLQWIKNISVFAALFLGAQLFDVDKFAAAWWTFVSFCLASSAMYLLNDVVDRRADQLHPTKKRRPIAAGVVPVWLALSVSLLGMVAAFELANGVHRTLVVMVVGYIVLQLAYSLVFKRAIP